MKYFIELAYNGSAYHGWQRQKNAISVQEVIEDCLSQVLKHPTHIIGCGRTDSGVHASQFFGHIKTNAKIPDEFNFRMNKILPSDIAVYQIFPVPLDAHAQHSASRRSYHYYLHDNKNPLIHQTSTWVDFDKIDFQKMEHALKIICSITDFKSVCKNANSYKTTICRIHETKMIKLNDEQAKISISSNRFLRAMMRLLISNVLKVGKGRLSLADFEQGLKSPQGFVHFDPAPPQGLHLAHILYPEEVLVNYKNFKTKQEV